MPLWLDYVWMLVVNRFIIRERLGTKEIREQAFRELKKAGRRAGQTKLNRLIY